jgi:hypothetical protein
MAMTTISGILTKIGMGKLGRLGLEPAVRYEREHPGELIHIDVKKLGRISRPGWRVTGGRRSRGAAGYHSKAHHLGWEFVHIGGAYSSKIHAIACRTLHIKHRPTRPYRPQTNGKAERFIAPCS